MIRMVNRWIEYAVERGVHLESTEAILVLHYRIDGVLQKVEKAPPQSRAAVVSRLKIMARFDSPNATGRRMATPAWPSKAARSISLRVSVL
ncbi:hypothetical protein [Ferrovibrio sp.]|uniref:ATPase, T2SS/T4P/T4SS family n=1 Tax=Ferrovibrio sp. TaxID=1917215 RepID=UPI003513AD20